MFCYIILLIAGLVIVFYLPFPYAYHLSIMMNKYDCLKKTIHCQGKRIIIVGGSGAWVGVDSPQLKKDLDYEPVNLGFYAGFGIEFFLRSLAPTLGKGDVVLVIPEYSVLFTSCKTNALGRKWLLAADPGDAIRILYSRPAIAPKILTDIAALDQYKVVGLFQMVFDTSPQQKPSTTGYYKFAEHNNSYGDGINGSFSTVPTGQLVGYRTMFSRKDFDAGIIPLLSVAAAAAQKAGARLIYSWPAFPRAELERNRNVIHDIAEKLKDIPGLKIAGTPEDFSFGYSAFTNSVYHITPEARKERTIVLVRYLQQEMHEGR